MKKHIWVKAGHHMLIAAFGILLPLGAAQADNQDTQQMQRDRMQSDRSGSTWMSEPQGLPPTEQTPPSGLYDSQSSPQGAQGPIRSDSMSADRYEGQRDSSGTWRGERYTGRERFDMDKNRTGRYYDPDPTQKLMFGGP